jgi:hypothetical protein
MLGEGSQNTAEKSSYQSAEKQIKAQENWANAYQLVKNKTTKSQAKDDFENHESRMETHASPPDGRPVKPKEMAEIYNDLFINFVLAGVKLGWFKSKAKDGTPLRPMTFQVEDVDSKGNIIRATQGREAMYNGIGDSPYFCPEEAEKFRVEETEGKLYWAHGNSLNCEKASVVDTIGFRTKGVEATLAFVMNEKKELYLFPHATLARKRSRDLSPPWIAIKSNTCHSFITQGRPVIAAGLIGVYQGKVSDWIDESGHYCPEAEHSFRGLEILQGMNVLQKPSEEISFYLDIIGKDSKVFTSDSELRAQIQSLAPKASPTPSQVEQRPRNLAGKIGIDLPPKGELLTAAHYNEMVEKIPAAISGLHAEELIGSAEKAPCRRDAAGAKHHAPSAVLRATLIGPREKRLLLTAVL